MPTPEHSFILKVLSGLHQGAEVGLVQGDLLVGRDNGCDVILSDTHIAPQQFRLTVKADFSLSVAALAEGVYVQGKRLSVGSSVAIKPFDFISVGTTHVVVGPVDEQWPPLTAADAPALIKEEPVATPIDGEKSAAELAQAPTVTELGDPLLIEEDAGRFPWLRVNWWKKNKKMSALLGGIILCAGIGCVAWKLRSAPTEGMSPDEMLVLRSQIENVERDLNIASPLAYQDLHGRLVVCGYVKTNAEESKMEQAIAQLDSSIITRIYSEMAMQADVQKLLHDYNLPCVKFDVADLGVVEIRGYVKDNSVWENARSSILQDVPGVQTIQGNLLLGSQIVSAGASLLAQNGLDAQIVILPDVAVVTCKGVVTSSQLPAWQDCRQQIAQLIDERALLKDFVVTASETSPEVVYFDQPIALINVSDPAWISVVGGARYFKNAVLPTGYVLKDIQPEKILLQKGSQTITLDLNP